jgi:hypothetical protein
MLARLMKTLGITALIALGVLENMQELGLCENILEMEHNSPEYLHALVEALRYGKVLYAQIASLTTA